MRILSRKLLSLHALLSQVFGMCATNWCKAAWNCKSYVSEPKDCSSSCPAVMSSWFWYICSFIWNMGNLNSTTSAGMIPKSSLHSLTLKSADLMVTPPFHALYGEFPVFMLLLFRMTCCLQWLHITRSCLCLVLCQPFHGKSLMQWVSTFLAPHTVKTTIAGCWNNVANGSLGKFSVLVLLPFMTSRTLTWNNVTLRRFWRSVRGRGNFLLRRLLVRI